MTVTGGLLELHFGSTYLPRHATYWPVVFCFSLFSRFNFWSFKSEDLCLQIDWFAKTLPYVLLRSVLHLLCSRFNFCMSIFVDCAWMFDHSSRRNFYASRLICAKPALHALVKRFTFIVYRVYIFACLKSKNVMQIGWFALNLPYMLWLSVLHLLFSLVGYNFCMSMLIDYAWIFHLSHSKNMIYEPCRSLICVTCKY